MGNVAHTLLCAVSTLMSTPFVFAITGILTTTAHAQIYPSNLPANHPAIQYFEGPLADPVARLSQRIATGDVKARIPRRPWVPAKSSRTSPHQSRLTSPGILENQLPGDPNLAAQPARDLFQRRCSGRLGSRQRHHGSRRSRSETRCRILRPRPARRREWQRETGIHQTRDVPALPSGSGHARRSRNLYRIRLPRFRRQSRPRRRDHYRSSNALR